MIVAIFVCGCQEERERSYYYEQTLNKSLLYYASINVAATKPPWPFIAENISSRRYDASFQRRRGWWIVSRTLRTPLQALREVVANNKKEFDLFRCREEAAEMQSIFSTIQRCNKTRTYAHICRKWMETTTSTTHPASDKCDGKQEMLGTLQPLYQGLVL